MEQQPRQLPGLDGTTADWLLHLIAATASSELRTVVDSARRGIRSGRPEHDFVVPEEVEIRLRNVRASADSNVVEVLDDVLQLFDGTEDALAIRDRWNLTGSPPVDWGIEAAEFLTTRSADEINDQVTEMLERGDDLEILIRGHLWLEYSVNRLLDRVLPNPRELEHARLTFSQRLSLLAALDVATEEIPALRVVNRLRNRFAHDLESVFNEQDARDLLASVNPDMRRYIGDVGGPEADAQWKIHAAIAALIYTLHAIIDGIDAQNRFNNYLTDRVQRVLRTPPNNDESR